MIDGLSWTAIGVIGGLVGLAVAGLFGLLLSIRGQLSKIAAQIKGLDKEAASNDAEHTRLWARIDDHVERITILEVSRE